MYNPALIEKHKQQLKKYNKKNISKCLHLATQISNKY